MNTNPEAVETVIAQACMATLRGAGRRGLLEAVVTTTVSRSAGRSANAFIGKFQVVRALKELKAAGRIDYSAGRWFCESAHA